MNKLTNEKRAQILSVLCEGMGVNAAPTLAKRAPHTKTRRCATSLASALNATKFGLSLA